MSRASCRNRNPLFRYGVISCVVSVCLLCSACAATRVTTTEYTSVEEALLSRTIRSALKSLQLEAVEGKKFFILPPQVVGASSFSNSTDTKSSGHLVEPRYVELALAGKLLEFGGLLAKKQEDADLLVFPLLHTAAIDDAGFALGLPSIPIPVPGSSTVETPELTLFGRHDQTGRVSLTVYAVHNASGELAFSTSTWKATRFYSRWDALFIFGWRSTNLGKPY